MATFKIYNEAGVGAYMPDSTVTVNEMLGSSGPGSVLYYDGTFTIMDMLGSYVDLGAAYQWTSSTSINVPYLNFGINDVLIGEISGLNLNADLAQGTTITNAVMNNGDDWMEGNSYNDLIHGGAGHDFIVGWGGNDALHGDSGDDGIAGDTGNDYINGGDGYDGALYGFGNSWEFTFQRQANGDVIVTDKTGYAGVDYLTGVEALAFDDGVFSVDALAPLPLPPQPPASPVLQVEFHGTNSAEYITGNAAGNKLFGYGGNDKVRGEGGNDDLYGGKGADQLWGGAGADAFVFNAAPSTGKDAIKDFSVRGGDEITLENAFFRVGSSLSSSEFRVNNSGKAQDGNDKVIYDKDSGVLYYDADGTGSKAGVAFASISKGLKLSYHDFDII